jgi:electron transfer flavoprotein alpha/beta subunit
MKENAILKKININKNEFIKVKREKELKKIEQNGIEVPALQTIDLTKNDSRNITAPNKVGIKQKKKL